MKSGVKAWIFFLLTLAIVASCGTKSKPLPGRLYSGLLFGKPYTIEVVGDSSDYQKQIDSIIDIFHAHFDILNPKSTISRFNAHQRRDSLFVFVDSTKVFGQVFDQFRDLHNATMRYYDLTTGPLKRAWMEAKMRGYKEPNLDSLFKFVGYDGAKMDLIEVTDDGYQYRYSSMRKSDARVEADFTPLASAVALDHIADFLMEKKVLQYRIVYGQSTLVNGTAIDSLNIVAMGVSNDSTDQFVRLTGGAYTYKGMQDKIYLVDPTYGYPVDNEMVYVAIQAPTLAQAEAFSESFLIMGLEQAAEYYKQNDESRIQSFVFYKEGETELKSASTEGFDQLIVVRDTVAP